MAPSIRRASLVLLVAAGYIVAGKLSHFLDLPSGYANIIWLPSGVALAALLMMGYAAWPGVMLGALAIHAWRLLGDALVPAQGEALVMVASLGAGATAQAVIGAWLVRRYVGSPGPLDMARDIGLFLLLGCGLASLVGALWGSAFLVFTGTLAPDAYLENAGMWWLGDTLGAVIVAPTLLTLGADPRPLWRSRCVSLGIPLIGVLALAVTSFALVRDREIGRLSSEFEHRAVRVVEDLVLHFQRRLDSVNAMASMIEVEAEQEPRAVMQFASRVLEPLPGALALLWIPRDPHAAPDRAMILPDEPDARYQVRLSAWRTEAGDLLGQEMSLVSQAHDAMRMARDTGAPVATAPMGIERGNGPERGLLILMPVYESRALHDGARQTVAARRQGLRGFVAELLVVDRLIEEVLHGMGEGSIAIRLWDATEAGHRYSLYARDAVGPMLPQLEGEARCEVAGRRWHVVLTPTMAAVSWHRPWDTWVLLGSGLLVAALLGALLLLVSGHTARVQSQASEHARALSQAQHSLQEAAFLRRLANSNIIGIMIVNPDGRMHDANDALLDMIGYTREDLVNDGLRWDTLTPPEWEEVDRQAVEHSRTSDTVPAWEKEYLRKDGSRVPIMMGVARLDHDSDRHVAFVVDLTKVKEAEAALKRRTAELENYKIIINSTPIAVYVKEYGQERQGRYALANPKAAALMGKAQPVGCTDRDWLPDDLSAEAEAHDRQVLQRKDPMILEERLVDAETGRMGQFLCTKVPLFDDAGEPHAIAAMALDITEQKQLTQRLAALVDAIPDVMFRLGADGECLDFKNNRDATFVTTVAEDIVGTSILDVPLPEDSRQASMLAIRDAIRTGEVQEIEYSMDTPRGTRHYEARVVKGGPAEVVMLLRDITEARRTREALQQTNTRLQAANEELKEFAYVASHDLQEPLRTVRSFVELLERRYGEVFDERGRKWLEFIVSGTQRMRDLIEDLLAYSRAGRAESFGPVDTGALIAGILDDSRGSIEAAGAEIEVGALPTVVASETELRQVFLNLISNALKFRSPGVKPRVEISAEPTDGGWRFAVADNGIGIDPEYHERIFQVFQRLHGRDEYPGTGIGLALVKKIVERQGGEIAVRSAPGAGTRFFFTWPGTRRRSPSPDPGA